MKMTVNSEQVKIWKQAAAAYLRVLSWHLPGETKDNYESSVRIACI